MRDRASLAGLGQNGSMRKREFGPLGLSVMLLSLSVVLYAALYAAFGRAGDIEFYTFLDIAFIPVQVLLVGLVLNRLLAAREKRELLDKLNMVIGAFFSEVGIELLDRLAAFDYDFELVCECLLVKPDWTDKDFELAKKSVDELKRKVDARLAPLDRLRDYLVFKRGFMLGLLENPNLLEHEHFTDLLWAVFHLTDELAARKKLDELTDDDDAHLSGDIRRAYVLLLEEWLSYMQHLQRAYPFMFSLMIRKNPFDPDARVEIP
jgi:hypothetical protein